MTARIDAAVVASVTGGGDRFWQQACTNVLHIVRTAARHAGDPAPTVRETAALMDNETVLKGLFEATTARTAGTDEERSGRHVHDWLHKDWRETDRRLQRAIRHKIRETGASKLTVQCAALSAAPTPIGDRRGEWLRDGKLLWDISGLPQPIQAAIRTTIDETTATPARQTDEDAKTQEPARAGRDITIEEALSMGHLLPPVRRRS